eukprot:Sspe_Gene.55514::Locus_30528_Transcript_1_1_Confidence_1.000_Length_1553::g.55514::m.55514
MVAVRLSDGKGEGLFATGAVKQGDVVLHEMGVAYGDGEEGAEGVCATLDEVAGVELDLDLLKAALGLMRKGGVGSYSVQTRLAFFEEILAPAARSLRDLHNIDVTALCRALAAVQENSFLDSQTGGSLLFPLAAKANHACCHAANCEAFHKGREIWLVARRGIAEGEEVTIDYLNQELDDKDLEQRQSVIEEARGFRCVCTLCSEEAVGYTTAHQSTETAAMLALASGAPAEAVRVVDEGSAPPFLKVRVYRALRDYCEATGEYLTAAVFAAREASLLPPLTLALPRALIIYGVNAWRHQCGSQPPPETQHYPPAAVSVPSDEAEGVEHASPKESFRQALSLLRSGLSPPGEDGPLALRAEELLAASSPPLPEPPEDC